MITKISTKSISNPQILQKINKRTKSAPTPPKLLGRKARVNHKNELNKLLNSHPHKVCYEFITNIPVDAKNIVWDIQVKDGYIGVQYKQDVPGPTIETFARNTISSDTYRDGNIILGEKCGFSSIFGTGTTTIGDYCVEQFIISHPANKQSYKIDLLSDTGDFEYIDYDDEFRFMHFAKMKYIHRMGSYESFVLTLREMISEIDAENILLGRVHKFIVNGLSTKTSNIKLSESIIPKNIKWVDDDNNPQFQPKYFGLLDENDNIVDFIDIKSTTNNDKQSTIRLKIKGVGKRPADLKLKGFDGDKPVIIVYYEGSNQIAFVTTLRKGSGEVSLNNVVVTATVDKNEIALFLTSTDKMAGPSNYLKDSLFESIRPYILRVYPDTILLEKMTQLFVQSIIVENKGGKKVADLFRKEVGLEYMNSMTSDQKRKLVRLEKSKDSDRYDIVVDMIWETDNKLTNKTPQWLGEVKRTDFNRNDRNQLFAYSIKNSNVSVCVAISNRITHKSIVAFEDDINSIKRAKRLENVEFSIIDVADYGFNEMSTYREYLKLAQDTMQN